MDTDLCSKPIPKEIVLVNIVVQVKTDSSTIKCKIVLQILN